MTLDNLSNRESATNIGQVSQFNKGKGLQNVIAFLFKN